MPINNIFDKTINNKTTKKSNKNNNGNENKNKVNDNSVIIKFPNNIKNIELICDKKIGNNNNFKNNE